MEQKRQMKPSHNGNAEAKAALLAKLKQKGSLDLDDVKSKLGGGANPWIRELGQKELAGVHRRRLWWCDGENYRFETGEVKQWGPGRFALVNDNGERFISGRAAKGVLPGDEIKSFVAMGEGSEGEALPFEVRKRDMERLHVMRVEFDGERLALRLDARAEPVWLRAPEELKEGDIWRGKVKETGLLRPDSQAVLMARVGNEKDKGIESKLAYEERFGNFEIEGKATAPTSLSESTDEGARADLRALDFVTIDGESTKDFDDAVFARETANGWAVWVAIADVDAFAAEGGEMDRLAREQMTSVYLPHMVKPMFPRALSNGLCSLNPGEDRFALVCKLEVDRAGRVTEYEFSRALMKSKERLTYEKAQHILDGHDQALNDSINTSLVALSDAAKALREAGFKEGRFDMGEDETQFVLSDDGKIETIKTAPRIWTQKLIEECMLAANRAAAKWIDETPGAGFFRNHWGLTDEALEKIGKMAALLGLDQEVGTSEEHRFELMELLKEAKQKGVHGQVRSAILSEMSPAEYSQKNEGHYSLAANEYCHFTSPIRRYADLMVHRLIKAKLDGAPSMDTKKLEALSKEATEKSQKASAAESDARKVLLMMFMKDMVGQTTQATIDSAGERGAWVNVLIGEGAVPAFLPSKMLKTKGWAWSDDRLRWEQGDQRLTEGTSMECVIASVDVSARRMEIEPSEAPRPTPARP